MTRYDYFETKFNGDEIIKRLSEIAKEFGHLNPLLRLVTNSLMKYIDDNFDTEGTASGDKWQEWSDYWAEKRKEKGGKILSFNSDLRKSITRKIMGNTAIIGSDKEYAAIHNFGGEIKRKSGIFLNRRTSSSSGRQNNHAPSEMPQREFFRFSDEQMLHILEDIEWYYIKKIKYVGYDT